MDGEDEGAVTSPGASLDRHKAGAQRFCLGTMFWMQDDLASDLVYLSNWWLLLGNCVTNFPAASLN
jgi:hypothetical protein